MAEYLEGRKKYEDLRKQKRHKSSSREEQVSQYTVVDLFLFFSFPLNGSIRFKNCFIVVLVV